VRAIVCAVVLSACGGPCPIGFYSFSIAVTGTPDDFANAEIAACRNGNCQVGQLLLEPDGTLVGTGSLHGSFAYAPSPDTVEISIVTGHLVAGDSWRALVIDEHGTIRFDETRTASTSDDCNLTAVRF
jgi:hypothetical protein